MGNILTLIRKKFYYHVYFLFYYDKFITKRWPNFFVNSDRRLPIVKIYLMKNIKIARPFWNIHLTLLITFIELFTHVSYLYNNQLLKFSFWVNISMYPIDYRDKATVMLTIWLIIVILQLTFSLSTRLIDYQFLWILHLDQIDPRKHYLKPSEWAQLKRFKEVLFHMVNFLITSIFVLTILTMIYFIKKQFVIGISFFWSIFWAIISPMLCLYICASKYCSN